MMKRMGFIIKYAGPEVIEDYIKTEKEIIKPLLKKLGFAK